MAGRLNPCLPHPRYVSGGRMFLLATATHPDMGSKILCILFGLVIVRTLFRLITGKYEQPAPMQVKKGHPYR